MEINVGERDRLLRLIFGVYTILLGFLFIPGVVGIVIGVLGVVLLVTGLVRMCGIYALLGISTVSDEEAPYSEEAQVATADEVYIEDEDNREIADS